LVENTLMRFFVKKHFRKIFILLALVAAGVFLFRNDLLFAFQRMRLATLGCGIGLNPVSWRAGAPVHGCEKFWVHRADSYERFTRLSRYFPGLEADLVFDRGLKKFRVYHPPVEPGDLFADSYFQFNKIAGRQLWLDIKNLESSSFIEAAGFFEKADSLYKFKKNIIIESSQIDFVNKMAGLGFTVSYLVPADSLSGEHARAGKLLPEVKFVSQEDVYVDRLKQAFPDKKIITWAISFRNYFDLSHFKTLLADSSVAVVLINVKSNGYR
jgi:hypothetical protein